MPTPYTIPFETIREELSDEIFNSIVETAVGRYRELAQDLHTMHGIDAGKELIVMHVNTEYDRFARDEGQKCDSHAREFLRNFDTVQKLRQL